ncbi:YceI family protein [Trujillonella humicola]|uniref:YceI family protein n=1 Tax=Trujillonella humicola TaxID=3383699 RepID=UPI003905B0B8
MTADVRVPVVAAGTWVASDCRTRAAFTVRGLTGPVTGTLALSHGEVEVDAAGTPRHARAELDLRTVDTGITRRDADLRKPSLLDADRRPAMTWSADRFTRGADGSWTADGVLALRGTSTPLAVRAVPELRDGRLLLRATATVDRRSVGIRAPRLVIGTEVRIVVEAELAPARTG